MGNGQAEVTSTGRPLMQHSLATSTHTFEKEVQMYSQVCISLKAKILLKCFYMVGIRKLEVMGIITCTHKVGELNSK